MTPWNSQIGVFNDTLLQQLERQETCYKLNVDSILSPAEFLSHSVDCLHIMLTKLLKKRERLKLAFGMMIIQQESGSIFEACGCPYLPESVLLMLRSMLLSLE